MKKNNTPIISWKVPRVHEVPTSWKGQSLSDLFLETSRSKTQSPSIPMIFVWNFPGSPFDEVSARGHGTKKTGSCKVGLAVSSEAKQARRVAGMIWPPDFRLGKQNDSERRGCSETLRDHKQNMTDSIWFIMNAYHFSTLANTSVYIFIFIFNYLVLYQVLSASPPRCTLSGCNITSKFVEKGPKLQGSGFSTTYYCRNLKLTCCLLLFIIFHMLTFK